MCFTYIEAVVLLLAYRPASRARLAVQAAVLEAASRAWLVRYQPLRHRAGGHETPTSS